ncbi:hypothetical protein QCA50_008266 [Cerrena zonata]|uniref:Uncharacterized protein n=1 Tax=Cerrena zonata TaxID=2478898 RepID=A0AAW0GAY9_9APHY
MQEVFDCVRIWSICQHAWIPTVLVFVLSMFEPAINIYAKLPDFVGSYLVISSGPLAACWIESNVTQYKYCMIPTFNFTVYADRNFYRKRWRSELAVRLLLDWHMVVLFSLGRFDMLKYPKALLNSFSALLLLNILAVLLNVLAIAANGSISPNTSTFIFIQIVLTSIILSHFILSLRSIYHTTDNSLQTGSKQSSLHFISAIEGNMGATLSGSWGSNREDEEEETEEIQYSEYPFSTGLIDLKKVNASENAEKAPEAGPSAPHASTGTSGAIGFEEIEMQEIV